MLALSSGLLSPSSRTEAAAKAPRSDTREFAPSASSAAKPAGSGAALAEFALPSGSHPVFITVGPDHNLWFTNYGMDEIGKITTSGTISRYSVAKGVTPYDIVPGPDGNLWFTELFGNQIGKITTSGAITTYPVPTSGSHPGDIVAGPDGNLWFTEDFGNKIAKITTSGSVAEFPLNNGNSHPVGITVGPDGNLWFTEENSHQIAKITTAGAVTQYGASASGSFPFEITAGPDGNLWATEEDPNGRIDKITTAGKVTEYSLGSGSNPHGIARGSDGNLWVAEPGTGKLARVTTGGAISELNIIPTANSQPEGLISGPDNNLWFTEYGADKIGRYTPQPIPNGNLVQNPGFESPLVQGGCCPTSVGKWLAFSQGGTPPVEESNVVHSGAQALEVKTPQGTHVGSAAYQDFQSFPANTSYVLSAWIYPVLNEEQMSLFFGWDRGAVGNLIGFSAVTIFPDHIGYGAWGQSATVNTTSKQYYDSWHQFTLEVDAASRTSRLLVDGQQAGPPTAPGSLVPQSDATIHLGQGSGQSVPGDHFYWDDISLVLGATVTPSATTAGGVPGDNSTTCPCGRPINTATGEFYHTWSDLTVPGRGIALDFTRTYSTNLTSRNGPLGIGWTDSYNTFLSIDSSTGFVTIHQANGAEVIVTPNPSGGYLLPTSDFATFTKESTTGNYTYRRDTGESYVFSPSGQLIKEIDRNGYVTTLSYSGAQLQNVTDAAGRRLQFTYGAGGQVASVTDPAGRTVSFTYDASGNMTSAANIGRGLWSFTYDSSHRMLSMTDPNGGVTTNVYDPSGRVVSQTDPLKRKTTLSYTNSGGSQTTIETDPRGIQTKWDYQTLELVKKTVGVGTPQSASTSYAYDPSTLGVSSVTDPNGHTTTSTYDAQGDLLTTIDPLGRKTTYTYNAFKEVTNLTDPLGVTTTKTYDTKGQLTSVGTPVGTSIAKTTYSYADRAHPDDVTAMTNPNNNTWTFTYDKYGDQTSSTDPVKHTTNYTYDTVGHKVSMTTPLGHKTAYAYDVFGNIELVTDPLGNKTTDVYDKNQNLTAIKDANGNSTAYTYDRDDERTAIAAKNAAGAIVTSQGTTYDADGNVISQLDGLGHTTTYQYDPLNRVAAVADPLGNKTTYAYDLAGNLISLTDPQGRTTGYVYDAANELRRTSYSNRSTPTVSLAYDADGQRISMNDGSGTTSYTRDALHRVIGNKQGDGSSVAYAYDLTGNLTAITYPDGNKVVRAYDAANRLTAITDWFGNKTTFSYDFDSNLTRQNYPNGVSSASSYDTAERLTQVAVGKGPSNLLTLAYARDKVGLLTKENGTRYGYDGANRLTSSTQGPSPISYDKATDLTGLGSQRLSYNSGSELASLTGASASTHFTYDGQGNRTSTIPTSGPATSYSYDQADRLVGFSRGSARASFAYDGDGLRMAKIADATTTNFVWDVAEGLPLILKAGEIRYVTGPNGLPLEQVSSDGTVLYYHGDQVGSTRLLSNASGNVAATFTFDPYGTLASHSGSATTPFGFTGQYSDVETGLYYLRARYYDPATAQFSTRDPIVNVTKAPYGYADGNPPNLIDPTGMWLLAAVAAVAIVGILTIEVVATNCAPRDTRCVQQSAQRGAEAAGRPAPAEVTQPPGDSSKTPAGTRACFQGRCWVRNTGSCGWTEQVFTGQKSGPSSTDPIYNTWQYYQGP